MADYEIDEIKSEKIPWVFLVILAAVLWALAYWL